MYVPNKEHIPVPALKPPGAGELTRNKYKKIRRVDV